jgi:Fe-S-cluster containining protein
MKLSDAVAPIKVAMMDAAQKAAIRRLNVLKEKCPCKPGCSACCSRLVHISVAEALIIYEHLRKNKSWESVREIALSQYKTASTVNETAWFKMNNSCSVLDPNTKMCRAYSVRPTPCSVHFVTSDPSVCDPWSLSNGSFEKADFPEIHAEFMKTIVGELSGRGVLELRLPMPAALLFAERVQVQKGFTAEQIISFISSEIA